MGARFFSDALPKDMNASVKKQILSMMTSDRQMRAGDVVHPQAKIAKQKRGKKMTKTEAAFNARLSAIYGAENVHYEAITIRLANGHRYTPDFTVRHRDTLCHYEVKGGYRLHSYQRARLAFDQARIEWPCWTFVWAEKTENGWVES